MSTARVSSRKYFIPGCVGRGLDLDLRIRPAPAAAASGNPSGWAQAGPKWVGPRGAQVGGPTWGPSGWAQARNFGTQKNPKNEKSQNQNPFCPKCRQGFLCRKKSVPAPFAALPAHFLRGPGKSKNYPNFAYFPWWAHGPYSPGLGPLLLSTRGGAIGRMHQDLDKFSIYSHRARV